MSESTNNNNDEIWKPVVGYEGLYEISNYGRVKSLQRDEPKILSLKLAKTGYFCCLLYKNGKRKDVRAHQLVAQAFLEPVENMNWVNHRDGIKTNNYVKNLEFSNRQHNAKHAKEIGLYATAGSRKLSERDIINLCIFTVTRSLNAKELAKYLPVNNLTIYRILSQKTWKDVTNKLFGPELIEKIKICYSESKKSGGAQSSYLNDEVNNFGSSKYKGVNKLAKNGRFEANFWADKKTHYYVGVFDTEEEAKMARDKAVFDYFQKLKLKIL